MTYTISTNKKGNITAVTNFEKAGQFWYDGGGIACLADDMRRLEFELFVFNGEFNIHQCEVNKNFQSFKGNMRHISSIPSSWENIVKDMVNAYNQALTVKLAA